MTRVSFKALSFQLLSDKFQIFAFDRSSFIGVSTVKKLDCKSTQIPLLGGNIERLPLYLLD